MNNKNRNVYGMFFKGVIIAISFLILLAFAQQVSGSEGSDVESFRIVDVDNGIDFYSDSEQSSRFIELYVNTFLTNQIIMDNYESIAYKDIALESYPIRVYLQTSNGTDTIIYIVSKDEEESEPTKITDVLIPEIDDVYYVPTKIKYCEYVTVKIYIIDDANFGDFTVIIDSFLRRELNE